MPGFSRHRVENTSRAPSKMLLILLSVALLALSSAQGPFDEGNNEGFLNLISDINNSNSDEDFPIPPSGGPGGPPPRPPPNGENQGDGLQQRPLPQDGEPQQGSPPQDGEPQQGSPPQGDEPQLGPAPPRGHRHCHSPPPPPGKNQGTPSPGCGPERPLQGPPPPQRPPQGPPPQ